MPRSLLLLAVLSAADLQRLESYEAAWADTNGGPGLTVHARAEFGGRGPDLARHFLTHTDARPRNDAYFFVLRAISDADTAVILIRGLADPPARESGLLDRDPGEIIVAVEAVLSDESTREDPRIVAALETAISAARARPGGAGLPAALDAVRLVGLCRSAEAGRALTRLANDPDAPIRTAAAAALGQLGPDGARSSTAPTPARQLVGLLADPSAAARRQAAESLIGAEDPATNDALRALLIAEPDSRVVDAIVQTLHRRGAAVDDPEQCRGLIARTWEAAVAQQLMDCWRRIALPEQIVEAALNGPAAQRAAALVAMVDTAPAERSVLVDRTIGPARFDQAVGERLMESARWVLSQGDAIATSTRDATERALWELSGRNMTRGLAYADRITPNDARFRASAALARADPGAYDAARRGRQSLIALAVAAACAVLAFWPGFRRPALLFALSAIGLALWTQQASGVRDLPPPPLQLLGVAAIGFLSAGAAAAVAALLPHHRSGLRSALVRLAGTTFGAAMLGGAAGAISRRARLFPSGLAGWELVFDPIGGAIVAAVVAAALFTVDRVVLQMVAPRRG
jgi:hypothetical protein